MSYVGASVVVALVLLIAPKIWKLYLAVLWRPYALAKTFERQGIKGPPYTLLNGSLREMKKLRKMAYETVLDNHSNDLVPRVLPYLEKWCSLYGETILYWYGTQPRVVITDPELAKQILSNKFGFYFKPPLRPILRNLIGKGLILLDGPSWAMHRRILNPAFSMEKLKVMVKRMAACTVSTLEEWKNQTIQAQNKSTTIEMNKEFQRLTGDIIAHTAFGSSYAQGKEAFQAQKELQKLCAALITDMFIPGSQYLPTPSNIRAWKLDRKVKKSLRQIIKSRIRSLQANPQGSPGDDLLGLMFGSSVAADFSGAVLRLKLDEIMEECKTFFFAGHETTSSLLTWVTFLLSLHQDWQDKLRQEVLKECGARVPDADMLSKLKYVNLVLLETLRLYCPAIGMIRKASEDMKLGNMMIPKDTLVTIPILIIHRCKKLWGEDANQFNPLRFVNGVSKAANHPNALLGFSLGPRACIGQNFAMLEAKTVVALMLQRFRFTLSPEYKHAPMDQLTLQPQYGLPIIVTPIGS